MKDVSCRRLNLPLFALFLIVTSLWAYESVNEKVEKADGNDPAEEAQ